MTNDNPDTSHSPQDHMKALIDTLDTYISQYHGGGVELVEFTGKVVKVRLGGACLGCPLSPTTLKGWVAGTIRQFFPDVEKIESVD